MNKSKIKVMVSKQIETKTFKLKDRTKENSKS